MQETKNRIKQFEMIRDFMFKDLQMVSVHLENPALDIKQRLSLLARSGKLYDQIMRVENSLKREYKDLKKEEQSVTNETTTKAGKVETTEAVVKAIDNLLALDLPEVLKTNPLTGLRIPPRHNPPKRPNHIKNHR